MTAIVSWCLRRRSVVVLASILILGVGAFGATQLRQQYFPDVDFPFVVTNVPVTGLDAEGVDEQVAQPLEAAATNLEDVETTQTVSNEGARPSSPSSPTGPTRSSSRRTSPASSPPSSCPRARASSTSAAASTSRRC